MEERVCTVGDLASRTAEVLDTVKATKTPTFIDQGGSSSTVLVDADTYLTDMQALREFNRIYRDSSIRPSESITGSGKSIS
ncbi:MAG: RidA family protein [Eggerthellaceae bacterium]|nr:RidA family protein [Eggerthellaceae bacterium]MCH4221735.1 RidA family protein [Eggerthellaceae bacterium]